jgi:two-component system, NarL family, response regulator LiaR
MTEKKISVLIADDHTVVRKGLVSLLSAEKYGIQVIGEASDGDEAIQKAQQLQPDVILMDLVMPRKNGIEAIREIKKKQPKARILVLTSFAEDDKVLEAIQAGAYGFLLKDTTPDELVQTIGSVYADKLTLPQELTQVLLGKKKEINQPNIEPEDMTERELDVLRCLALGMSNKQIAQELSIGANTVRSHVSSIMRKLNLENRTQLAIYAREQGFV